MSELLARLTAAISKANGEWWDSDEEPDIALAEYLAKAALAALRDMVADALKE